MKETELVRAKARRHTDAELVAELARIERGLGCAQSKSATARYLTRREIFRAELARRSANPNQQDQ
ncbi:MAG: hypothetical protein FD161_3021 [Limisphaerales bacterium]|nr:MAG: hypothetical protein FD161_3021 [Limisphaerales bacterium]KAG0508134.1 MAG: hypothetical protein E1N63_2728 [Limisphaerales bacterium]TXT53013.1 MAG: hypothetical protein FD140_121 [Limisphaerales bacterium]